MKKWWIANKDILKIFINYQLVSKFILFNLLIPSYKTVIKFLLSSNTTFTSGDFMSFIFSGKGLILFLITMILMLCIISLDLHVFIIISDHYLSNQPISIWKMILNGLKSLKHLLCYQGMMLLLFVSLIFPLLNFSITLSPLQKFAIPKFITAVIFNHPLYTILYSILVVICFYITFRYLFTMHYVLIQNQKMKQGLKASAQMTKKQWFPILKEVLFKDLLIALSVALVVVVGIVILLLCAFMIEKTTKFGSRLFLFNGLFLLVEGIGLLTYLYVPMVIYRMTKLFYQYHHLESKVYEQKVSSKWFIRLAMGTVLFNFIGSFVLVSFFDEIFFMQNHVAIIAHRGGGNLGPENTLAGIVEAVNHQAEWTEIDVQRTKDGWYILNHDNNFMRLSKVKQSASELTLAEVKQLQVKNHFTPSKPAVPVSTLEEVMDYAKGKIGLFIELKGKTADRQMVDDVVKLIKERQLIDEAVILSLDYSLIKYTEETYPEILTGYLYYFDFGKSGNIIGDYMIMEESVLNEDYYEQLVLLGKKVFVWTVNEEAAMGRFISMQVDGIITDNVGLLQETIDTRANWTDIEHIMNFVLNMP